MSIASFFRSNARVKRDTIRPERVAQARDRIASGFYEHPDVVETAFDRLFDALADASADLNDKPLPARIVEALPGAIAEEELADRLLVIEPRPAEQMEGRRLTEAETMDAIEAACDSNGEA